MVCFIQIDRNHHARATKFVFNAPIFIPINLPFIFELLVPLAFVSAIPAMDIIDVFCSVCPDELPMLFAFFGRVWHAPPECPMRGVVQDYLVSLGGFGSFHEGSLLILYRYWAVSLRVALISLKEFQIIDQDQPSCRSLFLTLPLDSFGAPVINSCGL